MNEELVHNIFHECLSTGSLPLLQALGKKKMLFLGLYHLFRKCTLLKDVKDGALLKAYNLRITDKRVTTVTHSLVCVKFHLQLLSFVKRLFTAKEKKGKHEKKPKEPSAG